MREFSKFVAVRAACAILSYAVYLLALKWFSYTVAYAASYVFGIALAYYSSAALVFNEPIRRKSALLFPLIYVLQFFLGYVLIEFAVKTLLIPESLALAFSVVLTLPLVFLLSRWVVRIT